MIDIESCKRIYTEAFGANEPFDTELFGAFGQHIKTLEIDGKTVAMLFLLPCRLKYCGKEYKAEYIYAAATGSEYRGRGYMRALIGRACENDDVFYFLKPASSELEGFYGKLGFCSLKAEKADTGEAFIEVCDMQKTLQKKWCDCPERYILMYKKSGLEIEKIGFAFPME